MHNNQNTFAKRVTPILQMNYVENNTADHRKYIKFAYFLKEQKMMGYMLVNHNIVLFYYKT